MHKSLLDEIFHPAADLAHHPNQLGWGIFPPVGSQKFISRGVFEKFGHNHHWPRVENGALEAQNVFVEQARHHVAVVFEVFFLLVRETLPEAFYQDVTRWVRVKWTERTTMDVESASN